MRASITDCDECGEGTELGANLCWDCVRAMQEKEIASRTRRLAIQSAVMNISRTSGPMGLRQLEQAVRAQGLGRGKAELAQAILELHADGYLMHTEAGWVAPLEEFRFDSQVEVDFWTAYRALRPWPLRGLLPNQSCGAYRIDFAINRRKFGIEIDGLAYHNGQESFMRDRRRQRDLEMDGWRIVRFAAKEVMNDATGCVREAAEQAEALVIA